MGKITEYPTIQEIKTADNIFVNSNGELKQISVETLLGNSDISGIGDGSVKGALSTLNSNKVGSHTSALSNLQVGMTLARPAILYLVNDNVNATGNVAIDFANSRFWLTSGGIGQNNTHFIPAGATIIDINNLNTAAYCYLV